MYDPVGRDFSRQFPGGVSMLRVRSHWALVIGLLCVLGATWAQEFRATLNGRLTDPSGAGVPNATVTAVNTQTNVETTATTTEEGNYTIPFLQPGTYNVSAGGAGFKKALRENIVLQVGGATTVDFAMQIGDVAEQVTVTAEAPLLE